MTLLSFREMMVALFVFLMLFWFLGCSTEPKLMKNCKRVSGIVYECEEEIK